MNKLIKAAVFSAGLAFTAMAGEAAAQTCPNGQPAQNGNCNGPQPNDPPAQQPIIIAPQGGDAKADANSRSDSSSSSTSSSSSSSASDAKSSSTSQVGDVKSTSQVGDVTGVAGDVKGGDSKIESGAVQQVVNFNQKRSVGSANAPGLAGGFCIQSRSAALGTTIFTVSGGKSDPVLPCHQLVANNEYGKTLLVEGIASGNMNLVATSVARQMELDPHLKPISAETQSLAVLFATPASTNPGRGVAVDETGNVQGGPPVAANPNTQQTVGGFATNTGTPDCGPKRHWDVKAQTCVPNM